MPGPEFDVHLTGARDPNPSGQLRLAATIAGRYRLAAPEVAAALAGTPCRVAQRLPSGEAQALVDALGALGAVARMSPAGAALRPLPPTPAVPAGPPTDPGSGIRVADRRITLKSSGGDTVPPQVVDVAEQMEFAEPGPDGRTGVRGPDIVRCQIHGLSYNRRQASGCIRCLAPARARAKTLEDAGVAASDEGNHDEVRETTSSGTGWLRGRFASPARRALWGVAVALAIGLIPAAYHARATARRRALALRAEQAQVAAAPVTVEALARFDALDAQVHAIHLRGAGETLLIWVVVAGAAGFVWSRVT